MARPAATIVPIIITGSDFPSSNGTTHRIPKRDLMSRLQLMLEQNVLRIPYTLPALPDLRQEVRAFQMKYTKSGHDVYSAEGQVHDDLILSLSLATWRAWRP